MIRLTCITVHISILCLHTQQSSPWLSECRYGALPVPGYKLLDRVGVLQGSYGYLCSTAASVLIDAAQPPQWLLMQHNLIVRSPSAASAKHCQVTVQHEQQIMSSVSVHHASKVNASTADYLSQINALCFYQTRQNLQAVTASTLNAPSKFRVFAWCM